MRTIGAPTRKRQRPGKMLIVFFFRGGGGVKKQGSAFTFENHSTLSFDRRARERPPHPVHQ